MALIAPRGFGISNFRSFDEKGVTLDDIGRVNILIGKNNSGKSNVLRFLRRLDGIAGQSGVDPVTESHRRGKAVVSLRSIYEPSTVIGGDHFVSLYVAKHGNAVCISTELRNRDLSSVGFDVNSALEYHALMRIWDRLYAGSSSWPSRPNENDLRREISKVGQSRCTSNIGSVDR